MRRIRVAFVLHVFTLVRGLTGDSCPSPSQEADQAAVRASSLIQHTIRRQLPSWFDDIPIIPEAFRRRRRRRKDSNGKDDMDDKVVTNRTAADCHPICTWSCIHGPCEQACEPKCGAPQCQVRCKNDADIDQCKMDCTERKCQTFCRRPCENNDCPWCETTCPEPQCTMKCPDNMNTCKQVCDSPACTWECVEPTPGTDQCQKPECQLKCSNPKCMSPGGYKDFEPLEDGWKVIKSFPAPKANGSALLLSNVQGNGSLQTMAVEVERVAHVAGSSKLTLVHDSTIYLPVC